MFKAVLLDIAGVLYEGAKPIPGAVEAIDALQQAPVALRFVTNTSRQSPQQVREQLNAMGFSIAANQLYTAPAAITAYLTRRGMSCYTLLHPNLDREFEAFASSKPDAVVVADAGDRFDYARLNKAFQYLMAGAQLVAVGDNRYFKHDGELVLDAGPFIHALAYAAGIEPVVVGKPSATFFEEVIRSVPCPPEHAIMIGDDVSADCEGAMRAGLHACLVKTGKYRAGDEARCTVPGLRCANDLTQAIRALGLAAGR